MPNNLIIEINYCYQCIINIMMSTMREKKYREVYQNGTAFKSFAHFEEPNLNHRQAMEDDSFLIDCYLENCPKSALFAVFDGHGGPQVSRYLVKNMPHIFRDCYTKNKKRGRALFEQSFEIADSQLAANKYESGSTGTVCLLTLQQAKRVLYIGHVGDSSAYLFDDSSAEKLTPEHRCDNPEEIHRVKQAGGKILMSRLGGLLAITRAFGDFSLKKNMGLIVKPEVHKVEIRLSHKFLVVASDGLWDFVQIKEVQKILREQQEPDNISRTLIKTALASGSGDNITIIVVRL